MDKIPNIETLGLSGLDVERSSIGLSDLELNFAGLKELRSLTYNMQNPPSESIRLPNSLQTLSCNLTHSTLLHQVNDIEAIQDSLPALTELRLAALGNMPPFRLAKALRASMNSLTKLSLSMSWLDGFAQALFRDCTALGSREDDPQTGSIPRSCFPVLKSLALVHCDADDGALDLIAAHCPQLEYLNVIASRRLTGAGVVSVVRNPGRRLKKLALNGCELVSHDAVVWAREKGVVVDFLVGFGI